MGGRLQLCLGTGTLALPSCHPRSAFATHHRLGGEVAYTRDNRIEVSGDERFLRAEVAPVFSLVIHELATNAVKYGALSKPEGSVTIDLSGENGGILICWRERGGPKVSPPEEKGFGETLIEQAVPHELNGRTSLQFVSSGVEADVFLPAEVFTTETDGGPALRSTAEMVTESDMEELPSTISVRDITAPAIVLEDNFIIAGTVT